MHKLGTLTTAILIATMHDAATFGEDMESPLLRP